MTLRCPPHRKLRLSAQCSFSFPQGSETAFFLQLHLRNQFSVIQSLRQRISNHAKHQLTVSKPQLHFCRMYIHIQKLRFNGKMKKSKGIFVLHHIRLVGFLNRPADNSAFDITPVNKIIFKIPVISCNHRLSNKSLH